MNSIAYVNANVIPMERGERHSAILVKDATFASPSTASASLP